MGIKKTLSSALVGAVLTLLMSSVVLADGNETLGGPSIPIASGSGVVAAGTGLVTQPNTIDLTVPGGASIEQVLVYWQQQTVEGDAGDDTLVVGGTEVTGVLIGETFGEWDAGGPAPNLMHRSYRADITALGVVGVGANSVSISGLDGGTFERKEANGAGLLVIYDDGSGGSVEIRDGSDFAYDRTFLSGDLLVTEAQTFSFDTSNELRTVTLDLFAADVSDPDDGETRQSSVNVTVDGVTTPHLNVLEAADGKQWDTLHLEVDVPAGIGEVTVQVVSVNDGSALRAESLVWIGVALTVPDTRILNARITGGGHQVSLNIPGIGGSAKVTKGLTLHCDITLSNNLQINWPGGNKWHIDKLVDDALCLDDPDFDPNPPPAPADTYIGMDVGNLNGQPGSVACWIFEDHGEPGKSDRGLIHIFKVGATPVIDLSSDDPCQVAGGPGPDTELIVPLAEITGGNLQFHEDQPHK